MFSTTILPLTDVALLKPVNKNNIENKYRTCFILYSLLTILY